MCAPPFSSVKPRVTHDAAPTKPPDATKLPDSSPRASPGTSTHTIEDLFAVAAKTGHHRMSINVMRELHASDSTWIDYIPRIMCEEDDHSMFKLSLGDILAVDISGITDPNARCVVALLHTIVCDRQRCSHDNKAGRLGCSLRHQQQCEAVPLGHERR